MGPIFEDIIAELLMPRYDQVGRWWHKGEEIDVVAVNKRKKEVLFAEVKWRNRKMGWREYEDLRRKSELVKGLEGYSRRYLLVSKAGFRNEDKLRDDGVELWDLGRVEAIIKGR